MACQKMSKMMTDEFTQFLLDQVPRFDEMIMESIRPMDGWLIMRTPEEVHKRAVRKAESDYQRVLRIVRAISENAVNTVSNEGHR